MVEAFLPFLLVYAREFSGNQFPLLQTCKAKSFLNNMSFNCAELVSDAANHTANLEIYLRGSSRLWKK